MPIYVQTFVAFFGIALMLSIAAERFRIPAPVVLVVAGALIHWLAHIDIGFNFGPALLFIFLPPLIFEASWSLDLRAVRKRIWRILYLAIPGTIFSAAIVAFGLAASGILSPENALLFGAIVSATDPVAVTGVFRRVAIPGTVKTIVEAESLLNDGIAVILYGIALNAIIHGTAANIPFLLVQACIALIIGIITGITLAVPTWIALRSTESSDYEVAMTVLLAYGAYSLADYLHASGIIATTFSAITLRALLRRSTTLRHRDEVNIFWNASATLVNTFVFFATGLLIEPFRIVQSPLLIVAIGGMLLSRLCLALTAAISTRARIVVFLAGMRGSLPLALALSLPAALPGRTILIDGIAASVVFSLLIHGLPLEPTIRRLYHHPQSVAAEPMSSS